mmetsp:Transcript_40636/g.95500  ORF Transcript_40636/g.95500 Transcript_40636/m.95500 type:complete len:498 (+) Transcript_40636:66-1559(+)
MRCPLVSRSALFVLHVFALFLALSAANTCTPSDHQPANWGQLLEFQQCNLGLTWPELAAKEELCTTLTESECAFVFKSGGLGELMIPGQFEEWVCVLRDKCAGGSGDPYFCYVYDELGKNFIPWNTNAALQLFPQSPCSEGWPSDFSLLSISDHGGFTVAGLPEANQKFGISVNSAGDVNNDGKADFIVSSEVFLGQTGAAWVFFGSETLSYDDDSELTWHVQSLDGSNGFMLVGAQAWDCFGVSVSAAGDVNGDGVGDIVVGAPGHDPSGRNNAGAAYVIFGRANGAFPAVIDAVHLNGGNGFIIHGGSAGDDLGTHVSGTGDVNGDGYDDVLLGAWHYDTGNAKGRAYVVYGGPQFGAVVDLAKFSPSQGFSITSYSSELRMDAGAVGWAGDFDGDGFDDVIIGAEMAGGQGQAFLIYGPGQEGYSEDVNVLMLDVEARGFRLVGAAGSYSNTGGSVGGAGDMNGDGLADLIIGAAEKQSEGQSAAGEAYVVYGR